MARPMRVNSKIIRLMATESLYGPTIRNTKDFSKTTRRMVMEKLSTMTGEYLKDYLSMDNRNKMGSLYNQMGLSTTTIPLRIFNL